MAWRSHGKDHEDLIRNLRSNGVITSDAVEKAMLMVDRGKYSKKNPYHDSPQSIGYGVNISAPHMHACSLTLLQDHLKKGNRALDVGKGGLSVGIDHFPELVEQARENINNDSPELLKSGIVQLVG
ncbi:hypothetical protein HAZT_HAZT009070 [Hyalella azteca]|uniref:protein-L-isoaspartate(D-aspartate) O-methyltransferase n=1 Tax=Hyalella azteca TaxID=294128 RepID=A0A6A0H5X3_HYAAZ|nr:hypothetical protein HAZT_HAZT009070 [Hyalella azteca]